MATFILPFPLFFFIIYCLAFFFLSTCKPSFLPLLALLPPIGHINILQAPICQSARVFDHSHAAHFSLVHVAMLHAACIVLHAACKLLHAVCNLIYSACNLLHAARNFLHAACNMEHVAFNLLHAACNLLHTTFFCARSASFILKRQQNASSKIHTETKPICLFSSTVVNALGMPRILMAWIIIVGKHNQRKGEGERR